MNTFFFVNFLEIGLYRVKIGQFRPKLVPIWTKMVNIPPNGLESQKKPLFHIFSSTKKEYFFKKLEIWAKLANFGQNWTRFGPKSLRMNILWKCESFFHTCRKMVLIGSPGIFIRFWAFWAKFGPVNSQFWSHQVQIPNLYKRFILSA